MNKIKIIVTGGGTGGHIIPLFSIIEKLKEINPDVEILYVGSIDGMEATMVPEKGINFKGVYCGKLRRYFSFENFTDIFKIIAGFFQSLYIVFSYKPSVIFAKGGYVTVPIGLAAGLLGYPLIVHESDTVLGLSNRILLRFVRKLCLGFPSENYPSHVKSKGECTGSLVNSGLVRGISISKEEAKSYFGLDPLQPVLLVTGGSQGARAINNAIFDILPEILKHIQIIHLCGRLDYDSLSEKTDSLPEELKKRYKLFDFISEDMPKALISADLVFTRGGANTLGELSILGKPSVIIPLPKSGNDHQKKNASVFSSAGAAIMIEQKDLNSEDLYETLFDLFSHPQKLEAMAKKASSLAKPDAATDVAKIIMNSSQLPAANC